jgi:transcriptional regulator with XRE-family HTH domain
MGLGIEIKKGRIDRLLQQQQLAKLAGISRKYLSEIEHEQVDPRFSIVQRIAQALGMSLDTLGRGEAIQPKKRQRTHKTTLGG